MVHTHLYFFVDTTSPVTVDYITGPHVSIVIGHAVSHHNKIVNCSISYGENATVEYNITDGMETAYKLPQLMAGVTYNYQVACFIEDGQTTKNYLFIDTGSFVPGIIMAISKVVTLKIVNFIGCFLSDLILKGSDTVHHKDYCLHLPHGMVCYSGHLPGSVATYMCSEGYNIHGDSSRECGENGEWSGLDVPECILHTNTNSTIVVTTSSGKLYSKNIQVSNYSSFFFFSLMIDGGSNPIPTTSPNGCQGSCPSTPTAVIAVSITVGLVVLCITICVVGSLICCAHSHWISRRSKKTQNESDRQQHLYDEISLCGATYSRERTVTSGRSETREENIVTLRNEAYYEVRLDRSHISTV